MGITDALNGLKDKAKEVLDKTDLDEKLVDAAKKAKDAAGDMAGKAKDAAKDAKLDEEEAD